MFLRFVAVASFLAVTALPVTASADPDSAAPPPIPNVNAYQPVNPADYTANGGRWYAFAGPPGVTCVLDNLNGNYGCSGALPGAPDGVNLVSAGPVGAPSFATTERPVFDAAGVVRPLPPNTRISYRSVSCGVDGAGVVACLNSRDQVGFVVGPASTFINDVNPLLARPDANGAPILPGLPPMMPGMPG